MRPDEVAEGAGRPGARDRILSAAVDLFFSQGIPASGVDALIERAGVAKATFYRQFPSKDDLVLAWLRSPQARWLDDIEPILERIDDPLRRLLSFWDALGGWDERRGFLGCPFLNTLVEAHDPGRPVRDEVVTYIGQVEAYLTRTAQAAELPHPADVGRELRILTMGVFMSIRMERSAASVTTGTDIAIEIVAAWSGRTPDELRAVLVASTDA
ncbi:MAG: TetR/AcrR family transcriptional regulator [Actinomycetota bacterium]